MARSLGLGLAPPALPASVCHPLEEGGHREAEHKQPEEHHDGGDPWSALQSRRVDVSMFFNDMWADSNNLQFIFLLQ
jgi:hypothetical protein